MFLGDEGFFGGGVGFSAHAGAVAAGVEVDDFAVVGDDESGLGLAGQEHGVTGSAA